MLKKVFTSFLIAFAILNTFCFFVYNVPNRVVDESGSVDYKWPAHSFHSNGNEGFSFGFINNDGFNNSVDYNSSLNIDILLMGSSHIEGFNVVNKKNVSEIISMNTKYQVYNIGISEHSLPICIANLENAITKYKPKKYIVIETQHISFTKESIDDSFNNNLPINSGYIMNFLQNFKYLKLLRHQMINSENTNWKSYKNDENSVDALLYEANEICLKHNLELIIVFHPHFSIDNYGNAEFLYNKQHCNSFKNSCEKYSINFINMEDRFLENYLLNNEIPYGFNNTKIGEGHLNNIGHKLLAEEIMEVIKE